MDIRKISLCIPVYNRFELLLESFDKVKDDPRIDEICIYSDGSNREYEKKYWNTFLKGESIKDGGWEISYKVSSDAYPKVKLHLCAHNLGVHRAKKEAVQMAKNEWVILFDSDNVISTDYLDTIYGLEWNSDTAYQPEQLKPLFDFRKLSGAFIHSNNLKDHLKIPHNQIDTFGNAQNFFINKNSYLESWTEGENVNGNDSLWFFYNWMKDGKTMYLVPNLSYFHRVDSHSNEQKGNYNSDRNAGIRIQETMNLIRNLK